MKDILQQYMKKRYQATEMEPKKKTPGPVVTISRECGCTAINIAEGLAAKLTKITGEEWNVLTKEILEEAAQKLELDPKKIEYVFESKEKSTWDEIFSAMASKYYKSDKKIKKTIADVVQGMARRGNCVIVGRGGVILTQDIEKSLHLKLQAPLDWRAKQLQKKYGGKLSGMKLYAQSTDDKREILRNFFNKKPLDLSLFDLVFNSMKLSDDMIINTTLEILEAKKII